MNNLNPQIIIKNIKTSMCALKNRTVDTKFDKIKVIIAMNNLQNLLIPKHQNIYVSYLIKILDYFLLLCDDPDVSIRHSASVIIENTVKLILPFQKSLILSFIVKWSKSYIKQHGLIILINLELKMSLFLTLKTVYDLFDESIDLYYRCAESSSEIVTEGIYKLAKNIRRFLVNPVERLELIRKLSKTKESSLSTKWSIKAAAIFAYPDLIDQAKILFANNMVFLSSIPNFSLTKEIVDNSSFEELVPFIEKQPEYFLDFLKEPPNQPLQLSSYFSCLRYVIPYDFKQYFPDDFLTKKSYCNDHTIYALQLECFSLFCLKKNLDKSIVFNVFLDAISNRNPAAVMGLSLIINKYPFIQLINLVLKIPISSPSMCKSIIFFLTEIDFSQIQNSNQLLDCSIKKLIEISNSQQSIVQTTLLNRLPLFNCGKTYKLFQQLFTDFDLFDPFGFRKSLCLIAELATKECINEINLLFIYLSEVDQSLLWGDFISLTIFLDSLTKICQKITDLTVPFYFVQIPMMILRGIVSHLTGDYSEGINSHFNHLQKLLKSNTLLDSILSKQSPISLLEIRDKAAECANIISKKHFDNKTIDIIAKKLLPWPSKSIWKLINSSAKPLSNTTSGILSIDPEIALASAIASPSSFNISQINSLELTAFAVYKNYDIDFELSIDFVKLMDKLSYDFPEKFIDKIKGTWFVILLLNHLDHFIVKEFCKVKFNEWNGPKEFWNLLPEFLYEINKFNGFKLDLDEENCDSFHNFFANKYIKYFNHKPFINYDKSNYDEINIELKPKKKTNTNISILFKPLEYYDIESLRLIRRVLYKINKCHTFSEFLKCKKKKLKENNELLQSILNYLDSNECENDAFQDGILLSIELYLSQKFSVDISKLLFFFTIPPFRGKGAQLYYYCTKNKINMVNFPKITPEEVFFEREYIKMKPISMKRQLNVEFPIMKHSDFSSLYEIKERTFANCYKTNILPFFSEENEFELRKHFEKYGISYYSLAILEKWSKKNDITHTINLLLNYVTKNGTFYASWICSLIHDYLLLHDELIPVIEAFIYVIDDSQFKLNLENQFKDALEKRKKG